MVRLSGQGATEILMSLPPQSWDYNQGQPHWIFTWVLGNTNLGFHACEASTLLTEPFLKPLYLFINFF